MKRFLGVLAGVTIATMAVAGSAEAQAADAARPVTIGLSGGVSLPMGDFGDAVKTGYIINGSLGFRPSAIPFGIRAEIGYSSYDGDGFDFTGSILSGTANGIFNLGSGATGMAPYIIGGLGVYNFGGDFDSETEFGINAGLGVRFALSGFNTFLEGRYHHIFTSGEATQFIPITFGVEF